MRRYGWTYAFSAALLLTGCEPAEPTDILGQAGEDKLLCINPDAATKTCSAISSFDRSWTGAVTETTEVLLPTGENITIAISSPTQVEGNRACGILGEGSVRDGIIRVKGSVMPPVQHAEATGQLVAVMQPMFGRRACDELRMEYGLLKNFASIEGIDAAMPAKTVAWVPRDAGYKVAAR